MERSLTLRDIQLLELKIANEIKRVCETHSIKFFIIGGTLLGAVRHKGFIPWDDDMDIGMIYDDYCKFIKCAEAELGDEYLLQDWIHDSKFGYPYAKVRLKGTHVIEEVSKNIDIDNGVWVDIFPYIPATKETAKTKKKMMILQMLGKSYSLKKGYDLSRLTSSPLSKAVNFGLKFFPMSTARVQRTLMNILLKDSLQEKDWSIECNGRFGGKFVFPINYFDDLIDLEFEGTKFPAPSMWHEYLSDAYGDYLTPPPASERVSHSIIKATIDE